MATLHTERYEGLVSVASCGEDDNALYVGAAVLAREIQSDIEIHGNYLSVRYFISDHAQTWEQATEALVRHQSGVGEATYEQRYSEITGYLWTDQDLMVGGHDLLEELDSAAGKYLLLEITYSPEPRTPSSKPPTPEHLSEDSRR